MSLLKQFTTSDPLTLGLAVFLLLWSIALFILHGFCKKKLGNLRIWRLLCCVPAFACVLHFILRHFSGIESETATLYGAAYIAGFLLAAWQFFANRKYGFRIYGVFVVLAVFLGAAAVSFTSLSVGNYTRLGYTDAFKAMVDQMEEEYVLTDWKEIDFDGLRQEILPLVEQSEREEDAVGYYMALLKYAYRFNDGHVCAIPANAKGETLDKEAKRRLAGNDYGMSLFALEDGRVVAILVEEDGSAAKAGIHSGTAITKWDGVPIKKALEHVECVYPGIMNFSVAANEQVVKPLFLAGQGGEKMEVSFLDDSGAEQVASLKTCGDYDSRLDLALDHLYQKSALTDENFSCKMLTEDCGYLRISSEESSGIFDTSLFTGDFPQVREDLHTKLSKLQQNHMEKLVIDLRNNTGGSDIISMTVASLFATEDDFGHALGERKDGSYVAVKQYPMKADGRWADTKVVVLVNGECCSAGDSMAWFLSKCPNVTLMGVTDSNGVDQNAGGICVMSEGLFAVGYPNGLVLGENSLPLIDTKADRKTFVPLDVRIAPTWDYVSSVFEDGKDYELDYALQYLGSRH